jgi:hypothetical protein
MNAVSRKTLVLVVLSVAAMALASTAMAQPPRARLLPDPQFCPPVPPPRLGINYTVIPGYGYRVNYVMWGTPASRIGLEPGDVVLSINRVRLTYNGAHSYALSRAVRTGGWVTLRIRDVRTGWVVTRSANLFGGYYGGGGGACLSP